MSSNDSQRNGSEGHGQQEAFAAFRSENNLKFVALEQGRQVALIAARVGKWSLFYTPRDSRCTFHSVLPIAVPEELRGAAMEYLTRANYGLSLGNFEMDLSDGEVRYKTSLDVMDGSFTSRMLTALCYVNLQMVERYLPGLMQVIYAGVGPERAIAVVEDDLPAPMPEELQRMRAAFEEAIAQQAVSEGDGDAVELDPELRAALEALFLYGAGHDEVQGGDD
jgi:hypothetical protein